MPLVTLSELRIGFHGPPLLDGVSCQIEPGGRIGLLGRNGSGKTTLLRILSGQVEPDGGSLRFAPGTRVALLPQDIPPGLAGRVLDVAAGEQPVTEHEHDSAWAIEQRAAHVLASMELPAEAPFESLSAGMQRRVLLARALVSKPDLLLLDEPTNHLDLAAIAWLEGFLASSAATLIFVTHDRAFLRRLATRILEIDRGRLFDWSCDYDTFLLRKDDALAAEEKQNALFDKRLAEEEVWIRTGIKARRTRNEGRVRRLEAMRRQRGERRDAVGRVKLAIQQAPPSGMLVAEAEQVSFSYGERTLFRDFSTSILRGDKIGLIGPNGAGKTTLLRVLLGQLPPRTGRVRLGANLRIAYFDQLRGQLREEQSVAENVGDGYETVDLGGKPRHVLGYLQDFLFTSQRARLPVRFLSGGERHRVLLAKLFAKPANVIVLDEPTNDLDVETLELLEARLVEFEGTVLLVSHDRAFLNNVVTSTIAFEEEGLREYVGGYDDWVRQRGQRPAAPAAKNSSAAAPRKSSAAVADGVAAVAIGRKRRPTFKERQERDALPARIEQLEADIQSLYRQMAEPTFYQQPGDQIAEATARLKRWEEDLAAAYERWEELDRLAD